MRFEDVKDHISMAGRYTTENDFPSKKKRYIEWACDHCDKTFTVQEGHKESNMLRDAQDHLQSEHSDEITRDAYPNEELFREWAERNNLELIDPLGPGDFVVASYNDGREVHLDPYGNIHLQQFRKLGGGEKGEDAALEGKRLVVNTSRGKTTYVSGTAFPIDR